MVMTIVVATTTAVVAVANKQTDLKSAGIPYGMPATVLQDTFARMKNCKKQLTKKAQSGIVF